MSVDLVSSWVERKAMFLSLFFLSSCYIRSACHVPGFAHGAVIKRLDCLGGSLLCDYAKSLHPSQPQFFFSVKWSNKSALPITYEKHP